MPELILVLGSFRVTLNPDDGDELIELRPGPDGRTVMLPQAVITKGGRIRCRLEAVLLDDLQDYA